MKVLITSIFIIGLIFLFSCQPDPNRELTSGELILVDSLYSKSADSIRILSDSICARIQESVFQNAVDSIIDVRVKEILALRQI